MKATSTALSTPKFKFLFAISFPGSLILASSSMGRPWQRCCSSHAYLLINFFEGCYNFFVLRFSGLKEFILCLNRSIFNNDRLVINSTTGVFVNHFPVIIIFVLILDGTVGGNFSFDFAMFQDANYTKPFKEGEFPVKVELGQRLFFEVALSTNDSHLTLFVDNCRATPSPNPHDPHRFTFIEDG